MNNAGVCCDLCGSRICEYGYFLTDACRGKKYRICKHCCENNKGLHVEGGAEGNEWARGTNDDV